MDLIWHRHKSADTTVYESGRYRIESSPGSSPRTGDRSGRYSGRVVLYRDGRHVCSFTRLCDAKARVQREVSASGQ